MATSEGESLSPLHLTKKEQERFLNHLALIKRKLHWKGAPFRLRSGNNFPQACGLASSASSFAALTQAACHWITEMQGDPLPDREQMATWSREGSGSSCRSFYTPWSVWEEREARALSLPPAFKRLHHLVFLVKSKKKTCSSSKAHERVKESPLYPQRKVRAHQRLQVLLEAFQKEDWQSLCRISWEEFQDMHQLFHSSPRPFSYQTSQSRFLLREAKKLWNHKEGGPLITMDAGPNVHLLFLPRQLKQAQSFQSQMSPFCKSMASFNLI